MIDNTEAKEHAVTEADVRKYEAEIATLRAQVAAGDELRTEMVRLVGGIKKHANALNQSEDDVVQLLSFYYNGLAKEMTNALDAYKEEKP